MVSTMASRSSSPRRARGLSSAGTCAASSSITGMTRSLSATMPWVSALRVAAIHFSGVARDRNTSPQSAPAKPSLKRATMSSPGRISHGSCQASMPRLRSAAPNSLTTFTSFGWQQQKALLATPAWLMSIDSTSRSSWLPPSAVGAVPLPAPRTSARRPAPTARRLPACNCPRCPGDRASGACNCPRCAGDRPRKARSCLRCPDDRPRKARSCLRCPDDRPRKARNCLRCPGDRPRKSRNSSRCPGDRPRKSRNSPRCPGAKPTGRLNCRPMPWRQGTRS